MVNIGPNDIFVVDVAKESEAMPAFVFGHILLEVMNLRNGVYDGQRESSKPCPDRIVIVIDEMNKYCSKDSPKDSPILKLVLDFMLRRI